MPKHRQLANVRDDYTRGTLNADATYYGNWHGPALVEGGRPVRAARQRRAVRARRRRTSSCIWNAIRTTIDVRPRRSAARTATTRCHAATRSATSHSNNYGLFLQDAWTVNNKLTLNLGLRADHEDMPSYRPENPGIHFGFGDKIAPRVGFAYDVRATAGGRPYGSWGMFYDITKLEMPRGASAPTAASLLLHDGQLQLAPSAATARQPGSGCPGTFIEQVDFRHVSNGTATTTSSIRT